MADPTPGPAPWDLEDDDDDDPLWLNRALWIVGAILLFACLLGSCELKCNVHVDSRPTTQEKP